MPESIASIPMGTPATCNSSCLKLISCCTSLLRNQMYHYCRTNKSTSEKVKRSQHLNHHLCLLTGKYDGLCWHQRTLAQSFVQDGSQIRELGPTWDLFLTEMEPECKYPWLVASSLGLEYVCLCALETFVIFYVLLYSWQSKIAEDGCPGSSA